MDSTTRSSITFFMFARFCTLKETIVTLCISVVQERQIDKRKLLRSQKFEQLLFSDMKVLKRRSNQQASFMGGENSFLISEILELILSEN